MAEKTKATQEFVDIKDIKNNIVYLKDGGLRKILIVNGINFDLKSAQEQQMILSGFQNFLNTLDFQVQFFIHSRKVNIKSYLEKIKEREKQETNELLRNQISEYMEFIRSFVEKNPIITKDFFVVVPYKKTVDVQQAKKGILSFFGKGENNKEEKEENLSEAIQQLNYRVDEVTSGLEQIGLRSRILKDKEIAELFYNLYNPELIEKVGEEIPTNVPKN